MNEEQNNLSARDSFEQEQNELTKRRLEELEQLKKLGVVPYTYSFNVTAYSSEILESFKDDDPEREVSIAGRIISIRRMGKASFCHIRDSKGKIQVYLKRDEIGSAYDQFKLMDIGDIVGVTDASPSGSRSRSDLPGRGVARISLRV